MGQPDVLASSISFFQRKSCCKFFSIRRLKYDLKYALLKLATLAKIPSIRPHNSRNGMNLLFCCVPRLHFVYTRV